jgi:hypothetical protein
VTCADVEGVIMSYAAGMDVPPEAADHIAGCEICRHLIATIRSHEIDAPSRDTLDRIEASILPDVKPVKPLPRPTVRILTFVFILLVVATTGVAILGVAGWHALSSVQRIIVFTTLAFSIGLLAFSLDRRLVPGVRLLLPQYLSIVFVLGAMLAICVALFDPRSESTFVSTGLVCLRIGLECAVSCALLFWPVLRLGANLSPILTGLTAGGLAGLSGLTVLEIFCPNLNQYHILVWHLGSVFVSVIGGLAIGVVAEYAGWRRAVHKLPK